MSDKLIQLLNKALADEYEAGMQYLQHYNNVKSKHTEIVDHFKEHMEDEQGHANRLAQRIYMMGGEPTLDISPLADFTADVDEALKQDILGENEAIKLYTEIINACEEEGDKATQVLAEDILTDEVGHIDEFAKFRNIVIKKD